MDTIKYDDVFDVSGEIRKKKIATTAMILSVVVCLAAVAAWLFVMKSKKDAAEAELWKVPQVLTEPIAADEYDLSIEKALELCYSSND